MINLICSSDFNLINNCVFAVYPQKQQYAYAGYPVPPPQAYTGPYYTTGSAYGPYNY